MNSHLNELIAYVNSIPSKILVIFAIALIVIIGVFVFIGDYNDRDEADEVANENIKRIRRWREK